MAKYLSSYFGDLDTEKHESVYVVTVHLDGQEVIVDLNFVEGNIDLERLKAVDDLIDNISSIDEKNKKYVEQDYAHSENNTVKIYLEHHLKELDREELSTLIGFSGDTRSQEVQLMNSLKLIRVGLYPENKNQFAIFDYSLGEEITQYIIAVKTDNYGKLNNMTMES